MNPNNPPDSQTLPTNTSLGFQPTSSELPNQIIPQTERLISPAKRSTTNLISMITMLVVAVIGLSAIIYSLNIIANEVASPASAGRGLATIFVSISMIAVVPVTSVAIFFFTVLALNLRMPTDATSLSLYALKSYVKKVTAAGLLGILLGALLVLWFAYSNTFKFGAGFDLFFQVVSLTIVPVAVLTFAWSFIYLIRAHRTQAIITAKSTDNSKLVH